MDDIKDMMQKINDIYPDRIMLTINEVAQVLGVSPRTVQRYTNDKRKPLPVKQTQYKGRVYIPVTSLAKWAVARW